MEVHLVGRVCVSMSHVTPLRNKARKTKHDGKKKKGRKESKPGTVDMEISTERGERFTRTFSAQVRETKNLNGSGFLVADNRLHSSYFKQKGVYQRVLIGSQGLHESHTGLEIIHRNNAVIDSAAGRNEESGLKRVVLKVCSQPSSIRITWAFSRNGNSLASPQTR